MKTLKPIQTFKRTNAIELIEKTTIDNLRELNVKGKLDFIELYNVTNNKLASILNNCFPNCINRVVPDKKNVDKRIITMK